MVQSAEKNLMLTYSAYLFTSNSLRYKKTVSYITGEFFIFFHQSFVLLVAFQHFDDAISCSFSLEWNVKTNHLYLRKKLSMILFQKQDIILNCNRIIMSRCSVDQLAALKIGLECISDACNLSIPVGHRRRRDSKTRRTPWQISHPVWRFPPCLPTK